MVKRGRRKATDRLQAARYFSVARALKKSAADLLALADESDSYGNAVAIVAIHSAIAYSDALSIAYGGLKSTEGDHIRSVETIKSALGRLASPDQMKRLTAILTAKDSVSYQGVYCTVEKARRLLRDLEGFADWAEVMFDRRPPGT